MVILRLVDIILRWHRFLVALSSAGGSPSSGLFDVDLFQHNPYLCGDRRTVNISAINAE